jgi:23S rRNA (adenine2503-C2)-methyltransferase
VTDKKDIRAISIEEITLFFEKNNEKPFRAKQVFEWLWVKSVRSFDKMANIPKNLLVLLEEHFTINPVTVDQFYKSKDKTIKFGFNLFDNNKVEGVLIPSAERITACVSTQVGCPLNCSFCATGKNGFIRNLTYAEIYDQVVLISEAAVREYKQKLSNIVYMGMGEPFLNYENTIESIKKITSSSGLAMSPQRITISTAGLPDKIIKFADENINVKLAISLHSAIGYKRDILMPVNKKFTLSELSEALVYYHNKTKNRVTFEYLLLDGFNDTIDDAAELAKYCRSFPVKINLIEYNRVDDTSFSKSSAVKLEQFKNYLESKNMLVNIRKSKGEEIFAACGQLSNKK